MDNQVVKELISKLKMSFLKWESLHFDPQYNRERFENYRSTGKRVFDEAPLDLEILDCLCELEKAFLIRIASQVEDLYEQHELKTCTIHPNNYQYNDRFVFGYHLRDASLDGGRVLGNLKIVLLWPRDQKVESEGSTQLVLQNTVQEFLREHNYQYDPSNHWDLELVFDKHARLICIRPKLGYPIYANGGEKTRDVLLTLIQRMDAQEVEDTFYHFQEKAEKRFGIGGLHQWLRSAGKNLGDR
jgi:hypothetical protein